MIKNVEQFRILGKIRDEILEQAGNSCTETEQTELISAYENIDFINYKLQVQDSLESEESEKDLEENINRMCEAIFGIVSGHEELNAIFQRELDEESLAEQKAMKPLKRATLWRNILLFIVLVLMILLIVETSYVSVNEPIPFLSSILMISQTSITDIAAGVGGV